MVCLITWVPPAAEDSTPDHVGDKHSIRLFIACANETTRLEHGMKVKRTQIRSQSPSGVGHALWIRPRLQATSNKGADIIDTKRMRRINASQTSDVLVIRR